MEKNNSLIKKLLLLAILFTAFKTIAIVIYSLEVEFGLAWALESLLMAIVCFGMYYSYKSHNKNVMKPLIGAALMMILYYHMEWALYYGEYFTYLIELYPGEYGTIIYAVLWIALFIVILLINIMHYVINASHHSNPKNIKINKILFILFVALSISQVICSLFIKSSISITISNLADVYADIFMVRMIISIEGTLDEFKLERENKIEEIVKDTEEKQINN